MTVRVVEVSFLFVSYLITNSSVILIESHKQARGTSSV